MTVSIFSFPLVAIFLVALSGSFSCVAAHSENADPIAQARRAAVEILVDGRLDGSGWIATSDGSVITAAHVIWRPHQKIEVTNPEIGRLPAVIVATDPQHDLARLQIQTPEARKLDFPILEIAKAAPVEGGDVFLYGSALFRHWVAVRGSMARREPSYEYISILGCYCRFSIIAAPSPQGTSGGCWLNSAGQVIGNQSGFINDNSSNPSGLAIVAPIDAIHAILTAEGDGKANTLGCGFEETFSQSPGFMARLPAGATGVITVPIRKGGAAEMAGLSSETLITHINGAAVSYRRELIDGLRAVKLGSPITLTCVTPQNHQPTNVRITPHMIQRAIRSKSSKKPPASGTKVDR